MCGQEPQDGTRSACVHRLLSASVRPAWWRISTHNPKILLSSVGGAACAHGGVRLSSSDGAFARSTCFSTMFPSTSWPSGSAWPFRSCLSGIAARGGVGLNLSGSAPCGLVHTVAAPGSTPRSFTTSISARPRSGDSLRPSAATPPRRRPTRPMRHCEPCEVPLMTESPKRRAFRLG